MSMMLWIEGAADWGVLMLTLIGAEGVERDEVVDG